MTGRASFFSFASARFLLGRRRDVDHRPSQGRRRVVRLAHGAHVGRPQVARRGGGRVRLGRPHEGRIHDHRHTSTHTTMQGSQSELVVIYVVC